MPAAHVAGAPQDASAMMSSSAYMDQNGVCIDPSQWAATSDGLYVGPDGMLYQPMVFQICPEPNESCTYYTGQEYSQLDDAAPQGAALIDNAWKYSKDPQGCRHVQQAFDDAGTDEERMALTEGLKGHVWEAMKDQNANHVVQKCISTIRPHAAQFVIDELRQRGPTGVAQAARHRFGCRIMERLLEHCNAEQVKPLVEEILPDTLALCSHIYGNYVIQHLLEHGGPDVTSRITATLEENVSTISGDGYAGAVLAKALSHASEEESMSLANAFLKYADLVAAMSCSRWGHGAVKLALKLATAPERQQACAELMWRSNRLRSSRYGRLVVSAASDYTPPICAA